MLRQVERAEMGRFNDAIYPVAYDHSGNEDKQSERTETGDARDHDGFHPFYVGMRSGTDEKIFMMAWIL
jgi:hypothetical protein